MLVSSLYYPHVLGGAERSVQFIAESLLTAGHTPVVITSGFEEAGQVKIVNGVKVYYINIKNIYRPFQGKRPKGLKLIWQAIDAHNPFMAKVVAKILAEEQPDVVHTNTISGFSAAIWSEVKQQGIPLVHTLRDYYLLCPDGSMYWKGKNCDKPCWSCSLYSIPKRKLSSCVDYVVGISQFVLDKHRLFSLFPNAKTRVIFNSYSPPAELPARVPDTKLRIGFIGRLRRLKGIETLLKAMPHFDDAKVSLIVAGKGEPQYEQKLQSISTRNVTYLGFVKPSEFFQQIDLLVAPSLWHEPLGRIVFEAYAYGIPVIGARRGGIPELIDVGKTGYLFDPTDEKSLVSEISRFVNDPGLASAMQQDCLLKAQDFLPQTIIEQYLKVYAEVKKNN